MKKIFFLTFCTMLFASTFSVEGMTCGVGCVNKIKMEMNNLDGVKVCDVDFESGTMTVDYDNSKLNDEKIKSHLELNTIYKVALLGKKTTIEKVACSKSCSTSCCSKNEKVGFFKKLFNWF